MPVESKRCLKQRMNGGLECIEYGKKDYLL